MNLNLNKFWPHLAVLIAFIIIPLLYFYPVLDGKVIYQSDIAQYTGMAKERNEFKKETGKESYWTNSAFGGMPTYQLGANYPNNYIKKVDGVLRFLPRPADYVFLYLLGFYILMLVLKVDYKLAFLGSLAFAFSTYYIIILGVGHNAKAHAIAYFPMVLAGMLLVYRKKYLWGGILVAVAMALEIGANHPQMTYYLLLLVLVMGIAYLIESIINKQIAHFLKFTGVLIVAVFIALLTNATNLLATKQYADWSTRGKSSLTFEPDGSAKNVNTTLDKEYITYYSYGVTESFNLYVPRLFGGSNSENLGDDSKVYSFLKKQGYPESQITNFTESLPTYWGPQPGTSAPAYLGAAVLLLFFIGVFLVKGSFKWWLVIGGLISLFLSWGKNFNFLTNFMIDYFPLYDKFRAVSSIQVILELCVPILGIIGLKQLLDKDVDEKSKIGALKYSGIVLGAISVMLFILKATFDFKGANDEMYRQYFGDNILSLIVADRKAMYINDLLRSTILAGLVFGVLWLLLKNKLKSGIAIIALIALVAYDLVGVDLRYVNKSSFVSSRQMTRPFQATQADAQILNDKDIFRVYDPSEGLNGARTSYFHKSVGGYHAAKPRRLQELFEYQVAKNNVDVLNMLNVKYIIRQNDKGESYPATNPFANGNAWFVSDIKKVDSDDMAMKALDSLDTSTSAIVNTTAFEDLKNLPDSYKLDSTATIDIVTYKPDYVEYKSKNNNKGVAVFSEMYYPHGWKVTIDKQEASMFRVNYALRGVQLPPGEHIIEFSFDPEVVKTGSFVSLIGCILLLGLIITGIVFKVRSYKKEENAG